MNRNEGIESPVFPTIATIGGIIMGYNRVIFLTHGLL